MDNIESIYKCLEEIISCLCYQPDIPQQHKTDMLNKLGKIAEMYYLTKNPCYKCEYRMPDGRDYINVCLLDESKGCIRDER
jgi:hypothetical protein